MKRWIWISAAVLAVVVALQVTSLSSQPLGIPPGPPPPQQPGWKQLVRQRTVEFGHRNWIVIADSAYPIQSRPGIETVLANADHLDVTEFVLDEIGRRKHLRPVVFTDAELPHVPEKDAEGIEAYRTDLKKLFNERKPTPVPHEELIARLDKAGAAYNILVLKTPLTLPYTSVFIELNCGYWSADAEKRMREAMKKE
jgi:hypothetical protein